MLRRVCCMMFLAMFVREAGSATITVRKDGTGDYSVIHSAVSAAADGDTILIGPGEFSETRSVRLPDWGTNVLTHGDVLVRSLTIIGAGEGVTVIGPASYDWDGTYGPHGISMSRLDHELYMSDLTIRNCYAGVYIKGSLTVQRCELRNNDDGFFAWLVGSANTIRDCRFSGQDPYPPTGISTRSTNSSLQVEDCEFAGAQAYVSNSDAVFRRCRFDGGTSAIEVVNGARCHVWDCDVANVSWGISTDLGSPPSRCDIYSSRVAGIYGALFVGHRTTAIVDGSVLTGGSNAVVYSYNADAITIRGCDFVKSAGPVFRCERPAALGLVTYDVANNYWGTSDEAQIREWIIDSSDDASIFATVQYSPFSGQSVPTESTTWGGLKALWR